MPITEAEDVFREMKRWLWLNAFYPNDSLGITEPLQIVDEMWHTFMLFSRDYAEFCDRYFGTFQHHSPTTHEEKQRDTRRAKRDPEGFVRGFAGDQRVLYSTVLEHLGERTVRKWYVEYKARYSPARIRQLQRKALRRA
jgi:hypothetical protein